MPASIRAISKAPALLMVLDTVLACLHGPDRWHDMVPTVFSVEQPDTVQDGQFSMLSRKHHLGLLPSAKLRETMMQIDHSLPRCERFSMCCPTWGRELGMVGGGQGFG